MDNIVDGFQTHVQVQAEEAQAQIPIPLPAPYSLFDLNNSNLAKSIPSSMTTQTDGPSVSNPSTYATPVEPSTSPLPVLDFTPRG